MTGYTPQPGDLFVCKVPSPWSKWIELGQWANGDGFGVADHAGVLLEDGLIFESAPWKARIRPLDGCGYEDLVWSGPRYKPAPPVRDLVMETAHWLINRPGGTPYSVLDYVTLAAKRAHIPAPHLRAYVQSSNRMICSQAAAFCAFTAGWMLWPNGFTGDVTPMDLLHKFRGEPVT